MSGENVQLLGTATQWHNLGNRVRRATHQIVARLEQIRSAIGAAAGLPMPQIGVEPFGWVFPDVGIAYGLVRPMQMENCGLQFCCILPVSTPFLIDDPLLRRILCHEFAHCFWYVTQAVTREVGGEFRSIDNTVFGKSLSELVEQQLGKDQGELVNPFDWFGEEDAMYFLREADHAIASAEEVFCREWLNRGLPTIAPEMEFSARGTLLIDDAIADRIRQLRLGG